MTTKKAIKIIKEYWQSYNIQYPYPIDIEPLLFRDLKECRSPKVRQGYVDMLDMLLKDMEPYLSKDKSLGGYQFVLNINEDYKLHFSFEINSGMKMGYNIHSMLIEQYEYDNGRDKLMDIEKIKQHFNISSTGKYNRYFSFRDNEDFDSNWDWIFQSILEDYKRLIKTVKEI